MCSTLATMRAWDSRRRRWRSSSNQRGTRTARSTRSIRPIPTAAWSSRASQARPSNSRPGCSSHSQSESQARDDYKRLVDLAVTHQAALQGQGAPRPVRGRFLCDGGRVSGGVRRRGQLVAPAREDTVRPVPQRAGWRPCRGTTTRSPQVLERHQLYGESQIESRTGEELLAGLRLAVQR